MAQPVFAFPYQVSWHDLDSNNHMRNSRYQDYASQTRLRYLSERGFTPAHFETHGIGPVVLEEKIQYRRELRFLEPFRVEIALGGMNASGSKFILVNRILREDGGLSANVTALGAWLDLRERRICMPPPALMDAMSSLPRTEDYRGL